MRRNLRLPDAILRHDAADRTAAGHPTPILRPASDPYNLRFFDLNGDGSSSSATITPNPRSQPSSDDGSFQGRVSFRERSDSASVDNSADDAVGSRSNSTVMGTPSSRGR